MQRKPFKKVIENIATEQAHAGSGSRKLLISSADDISPNIEAVTKGYLELGSVFNWHQHIEIDEFWIVTTGKGFIEYSTGERFDYVAGDFIYNPANLEHKIEASGDVTSEFFFVRIRNEQS